MSVCALITRELGPRYIALPTTEKEMGQLLKKMEDKFGFPQAFGCIDGTHIPIKQPSDNAHDFFSYKMKYTINVQGVCDSSGMLSMLMLGGREVCMMLGSFLSPV